MHAAVQGVFVWIYEGHGNWPFNTAYAAGFGLDETRVNEANSLSNDAPSLAHSARIAPT